MKLVKLDLERFLDGLLTVINDSHSHFTNINSLNEIIPVEQ